MPYQQYSIELLKQKKVCQLSEALFAILLWAVPVVSHTDGKVVTSCFICITTQPCTLDRNSYKYDQ